MTGLDISLMDLVGGFLGFFLTLFVFSYILGDNLLFRLAIHLFVGVSAGFVAAAVFYSVIWPQLLRPLVMGALEERLLVVVPLLLSLMLLAKAFPRISVIGSPVMAFLVGVGAATIVGGALLGTLFPQIRASFSLLDPNAAIQSGTNIGSMLFNGSLVLVGTAVTLVSFQFGTRFTHNASLQTAWKIIFWVGRFFIAITFGVIFAGVYAAVLTVLIERINFLVEFIRFFLVPIG